jgi:hypothetical protein
MRGQPIASTETAMRRKPKLAALPGVNSLTRQLMRTVSEVDDLRFRLHLPNDLADLFLRQLGLGEPDAVDRASHVQRSINHLGLVGAKKVGDVIRGRLGQSALTHRSLRSARWRARVRFGLPCSQRLRQSRPLAPRWQARRPLRTEQTCAA